MALEVFYGGTFDPVHAGHVAVASGVARALDAPVWLVPAADPPHRAPPGADAATRAALCALAVAGLPRLGVDERELRRVGPSYTVDTLAELRAERGPFAPIAWLVGADAFLGLHRWHRWGELLGLAHLVVVQRPGHALDGLPCVLAEACAGRWTDDPDALRFQAAGRVLPLELPLRPESATAVRTALAADGPAGTWAGMLPPAVAEAIRARGLYGLDATTPTG